VILFYDLRREGQAWDGCLCDSHLERMKVLGWTVVEVSKPFGPNPPCRLCDAAKWKREQTVLGKIIEADAEETEPQPVPVLPGQARLF
jgi:hypothetical protein